MKLSICDQPPSKDFEIEVVLRDAQGNPTGKTRTYRTDSAYKLWQFYMNNKGKPKFKKRKNAGAATKKEAEKIVKDMQEQ